MTGNRIILTGSRSYMLWLSLIAVKTYRTVLMVLIRWSDFIRPQKAMAISLFNITACFLLTHIVNRKAFVILARLVWLIIFTVYTRVDLMDHGIVTQWSAMPAAALYMRWELSISAYSENGTNDIGYILVNNADGLVVYVYMQAKNISSKWRFVTLCKMGSSNQATWLVLSCGHMQWHRPLYADYLGCVGPLCVGPHINPDKSFAQFSITTSEKRYLQSKRLWV